MNESPLPKVLLVILAIISLWSLYLCWVYSGQVKHVREMQMQINGINYEQQRFSLMLNEAAEYGRKNPALESLLRSIGITTVTNTAPGASAPIHPTR